MSKIKCIAIDLDRTALASDGSLPEENLNAIRKAIEKGIKVVIASGRPYSGLPKQITDIKGIDYAITSNGSSAYRISDGNRIYEALLSPASVERIVEISHHYDSILECFIRGSGYADSRYVKEPEKFGATSAAIQYIKRTRTPVDDIAGFMMEHSHELDSIDYVLRNQKEHGPAWNELESSVPDIYVTSSVRRLIEISDGTSGKHN